MLTLGDHTFDVPHLTSTLNTLACETISVATAVEASAQLAIQRIDALIIMEGGHIADAVATCRHLRSLTSIPIMLICRHGSEDHIVHAFSAGANEVVTSTSSDRVLAARLQNLINRPLPITVDEVQDGLLTAAGVVLDLESRTAWLGEIEVPLTRIEFDILSLLMSKPNKVFSRSEIITDVWRDQWYGDDHVLETHVSRLRKKIQEFGGPKLLMSLRGVGYRLRHPSIPPQLVRADDATSVAR